MQSVIPSCRVIAHIDLDAFYAQVESRRLGLSDDIPLAVCQWRGLIAINYAARKYGISRHENAADAVKKCPNLVLAHVPTWREGEEEAQYRKAYDRSKEKVSLDPYRTASRQIIKIVRRFSSHVEKASIDETFLDMSDLVRERILKRLPPDYDMGSETNLLENVCESLFWIQEVHGRPAIESSKIIKAESWHDVYLMIGSEVIQEIRKAIYKELEFTCSAGIACNKLLAKLASARFKPNQQTLVLPSMVNEFMLSFNIEKLRFLGGKFGQELSQQFGTSEISKLQEIALDELQTKFGKASGIWVYQSIRGIDDSEVSMRTNIQSMLSAKSFTTPLTTIDQASKWLHTLSADLNSRYYEYINDIEEIGDDSKNAIPMTITLHHRVEGLSRSRQMRLYSPQGINKDTIYAAALKLLEQEDSLKTLWPCHNLSLALGDFKSSEASYRIDQFFTRKNNDEACKLADTSEKADEPETNVWKCSKCNYDVDIAETDSIQVHNDYHIAKELDLMHNPFESKKESKQISNEPRSKKQKTVVNTSTRAGTIDAFFAKGKL